MVGNDMRDVRLISAESVTEGHPDKVCDQIADEILDEIIRRERGSRDLRCACEVMVTAGTIVIAGEFTCSEMPDVDEIARRVLRQVGYDNPKTGADADSCEVIFLGHDKPYDTASGENSDRTRYFDVPDDELDALRPNDQSILFGYACDDTYELMPLPIHVAHRLAERLDLVRHQGIIPYLLPDGKTMVTVAYGPDMVPIGIERVLVSAQHEAGTDLSMLRRDVTREVIEPILKATGMDSESVRIEVNPGGDFSLGGPFVDTGTVGRKNIVDTYGGMARNGGGALSGKDVVKVDRTGAYLARWIAKHVVAGGIARRCETQIAYAPGMQDPFSVSVDTFGTGKATDADIARAVSSAFDFRSEAVIRSLGLRRPIYRKTATYGHFGRVGFPWEGVDGTKVGSLLVSLGLTN